MPHTDWGFNSSPPGEGGAVGDHPPPSFPSLQRCSLLPLCHCEHGTAVTRPAPSRGEGGVGPGRALETQWGPLAGAGGAGRGRPLLLVRVKGSAVTGTGARKQGREQRKGICHILPGVEVGSRRAFFLVFEEVKG